MSSKNISITKLSLFIAVILAIGIVGKALANTETYRVLGASTLLARGGDDSGGDSGGSSNSVSGSSESSSTSGSSGSSGGSGSSNSSGSNTSSVSDSTRVLCTGPDGKQFQTELKDCQELNKAWNKSTNFTILSNQTNTINSRTISNGEKTESKISETERIRTSTKDGRTRIDITSGGIKTKLEIEDDKVIAKTEREDGTEVELEDESLTQIDDRLAEDDIKIATAGAGKFLLQKGTVGAITDFPISVDLATNTLFTNTPAGQKNITVLPEKAVQNLVSAKVISRIRVQKSTSGTINNNLASINQLITLSEKDGIPIYEISGISDQRLLGFIPVTIGKDLTISAETGNVLSTNESFINRILDTLSF